MRPVLLTSMVALVTVFAVSRASADDRAIAEQAFQEGRVLMAAGKVSEACPKFAAAAQLSQTPGVRLNLADCYARLGKMASAWAAADEGLALAERLGDSAAASLARERMAAFKPTLAYLTIDVSRESLPAGIDISLDGEKIPDAVWGTPFPVDAGEHEVTAKAPGRKSWSTKTTVAGAGARGSVVVPVLMAEESPQPSRMPEPNGSPAGPEGAVSGGARSGGTTNTLAVVSGGLGVVGMAIGTAFAVDASSKKSEYQHHEVNGHCIDKECVTISKDAVTAANDSTIAFVAGGVLAAAGIVLWLMAPSSHGENRTVALVPIAMSRSVGAGISGTF